jgi:hypothetical protein
LEFSSKACNMIVAMSFGKFVAGVLPPSVDRTLNKMFSSFSL